MTEYSPNHIQEGLRRGGGGLSCLGVFRTKRQHGLSNGPNYLFIPVVLERSELAYPKMVGIDWDRIATRQDLS